jgi:hypothetical protein
MIGQANANLHLLVGKEDCQFLDENLTQNPFCLVPKVDKNPTNLLDNKINIKIKNKENKEKETRFNI